jgi:hypothetical protein
MINLRANENLLMPAPWAVGAYFLFSHLAGTGNAATCDELSEDISQAPCIVQSERAPESDYFARVTGREPFRRADQRGAPRIAARKSVHAWQLPSTDSAIDLR